VSAGARDALIVVMLPNWVGDGVMAGPALGALRAARADARIILIGTGRSAPLFGRWCCDALIPFEGRRAGDVLSLARRLRSLSAREALVLGPSFRAALIPYMAGIPLRVGWKSDGRGLLLNAPLPVPGRDVHLARSYLALAARLGADPDAPLDPVLPIGDDERAAARRRIGTPSGDAVAILPGATYGETKRWPLGHWVELGRRLRARGPSLWIMGGTDEREAAERLCAEIGDGCRSLAGTLTLRESMGVLSLAACAISNDSGGMHLATAAGAPVIGIFGSTNPAWTGPLGERSRVVRTAVSCSPCYGRTCPTKIECLRDLDPERVLLAFDALVGPPVESRGIRPPAGQEPVHDRESK
jgi:heptosyltransferase II